MARLWVCLCLYLVKNVDIVFDKQKKSAAKTTSLNPPRDNHDAVHVPYSYTYPTMYMYVLYGCIEKELARIENLMMQAKLLL